MGTLGRSRTEIVVPRNVPPENFRTVSATTKLVKGPGLCRCVMVPGTVLVLVIVFVSTVAYFVSNTDNVTMIQMEEQGRLLYLSVSKMSKTNSNLTLLDILALMCLPRLELSLTFP